MICIFLSLLLGSAIEKIQLFKKTVGISSILIMSLLIGAIVSSSTLYSGITTIDSFKQTNSIICDFGSMLFIATTGLCSGISSEHPTKRQATMCLLTGISAPLVALASGYLIMQFEPNHDISILIGTICGAVTSSSALVIANSIPGINSSLLVIGYSLSYFIGILFAIVSVLYFSRKCPSSRVQKTSVPSDSETDLLYLVSLTVVLGHLIDKLPLVTNLHLGNTIGILLAGVIIGYIFKSLNQFSTGQSLHKYRKFGLIIFFASRGLNASIVLSDHISLIPLLNATFISFASISCCIIIGLLYTPLYSERISILAGAMTSTPALNSLIDHNKEVNYTLFSLTYMIATLTMSLGIKVLWY